MDKPEQIGIRISKQDLEIIKKAATIRSVGHSTFCRLVSLKEARKILQEFREGIND